MHHVVKPYNDENVPQYVPFIAFKEDDEERKAMVRNLIAMSESMTRMDPSNDMSVCMRDPFAFIHHLDKDECFSPDLRFNQHTTVTDSYLKGRVKGIDFHTEETPRPVIYVCKQGTLCWTIPLLDSKRDDSSGFFYLMQCSWRQTRHFKPEVFL